MKRFTTFLAVWLVFSGCAQDGTQSPADAAARSDSKGTLDTRAGDAGIAGCVYRPNRICWHCGQGNNLKATIGCRADKDCALFCNPVLPPSHPFCPYRGPNDSPPPCRGWEVPRPPLSLCTKSESGGTEIYHCPSCVYGVTMTIAATNDKGDCRVFADGCRAAGYSPIGSSCPTK